MAFDLAGRVAMRIGFWDKPEADPDLDCTKGDLFQAYNRGWNACSQWGAPFAIEADKEAT